MDKDEEKKFVDHALQIQTLSKPKLANQFKEIDPISLDTFGEIILLSH